MNRQRPNLGGERCSRNASIIFLVCPNSSGTQRALITGNSQLSLPVADSAVWLAAAHPASAVRSAAIGGHPQKANAELLHCGNDSV
jgi:hypothetical protein